MFEFNREQQGNSKPVGPKNAIKQYFAVESEEHRIDTIIREAIQNPLDHPINPELWNNGTSPVQIIIRHRIVHVDEIPQKEELIKTVNSLIEELEALRTSDDGLITAMIKDLTSGSGYLQGKNFIPLLQISDYSTTGISGDLTDMSTIIGRLFGGSGYFEDGGGTGGSGGLGKYASFLASKIGFCFYSSRNINNEFIYYGFGEYFTHGIEGVRFRPEVSIGERGNNVLRFRTKPQIKGFLIDREDYGTDIFSIAYKKETPEVGLKWEEFVAKAVIRNYFGSIIENKLIVKIIDNNNDGVVIDKETIYNLTNRIFSTVKKSSSAITPDSIVKESVDAYRDGVVFEEHIEGLGKCSLKLFTKDGYELSNHITYLRKPRMMIYRKKAKKSDKSFAGIFMTECDDANDLLRRTEDSQHKNWSFKLLLNGSKIEKAINKFIDECVANICSIQVEEEFIIQGTSLVSFGGENRGLGGSSGNDTEEPTSSLYPGSIANVKERVKAGEAWVVSKNGKTKKIEPKKPPYKERKEQGLSGGKDGAKREYHVESFNPILFKNDSESRSYCLYLKAKIDTSIRRIHFAINKAEDIDFIESIKDSKGNLLERDYSKDAKSNTYLNFVLDAGDNQFEITTRVNKKFEIIIS